MITEISINFIDNTIEVSRPNGLTYTCKFEVRDSDELLRSVPLIKGYFNFKYDEMRKKLDN